jgi:hypothetical protein
MMMSIVTFLLTLIELGRKELNTKTFEQLRVTRAENAGKKYYIWNKSSSN